MIGTIVGIKTTGERVYVIREATAFGGDPRKGYCVRRPSGGQFGVHHSLETFLADELEPIEENLIREINEMILKAKLQERILRAARLEHEAQQAQASDETKDVLN